MTIGSPDPLGPAWRDLTRGTSRLRAPGRSLLQRLVRTPTFLIGVATVLFWVGAAVATTRLPTMFRYDPFAVSAGDSLVAPSLKHWLGTDDLGRDVFTRVLAGAAPVLLVAPVATLVSLLVGTTIGLVAGYYRGLIDDVLMRIVDAVMSLPVIIPATLVLALIGRSITNVIVAIAFLFAPLVARTVRAAVLVEREREYVDAARLRGDGSLFIMFFEILPNITAPLLVEGTVRLGYAVFTAGTLSFLQLGIQPPSPDWGLTVAVERTFVQVAPWTVLAPALALASLIVGVNLATDGLRRTLAE